MALIGLGFKLTGTPTSKQGQIYDQLRVGSMTSLSLKIQSYYEKNKKLPDNLNSFPDSIKTDLQTKKTFNYEITGDTSYKLCTTFSSDSLDDPSNRYAAIKNNHIKGYDCLKFSATNEPEVHEVRLVPPTQSINPTLTPFLTVSPSTLVTVDTDLKMRLISVEKTSRDIKVNIEVVNSGKNSLNVDVSKIQMSYVGQASAGSIATNLGSSFMHLMLGGDTYYRELQFKNEGQSPYIFSYVGTSRTVVIGTAK